eukprot:COSAG01_NODE_1719_length_9392_cov_43.559884_6_plen_324_part_00
MPERWQSEAGAPSGTTHSQYESEGNDGDGGTCPWSPGRLFYKETSKYHWELTEQGQAVEAQHYPGFLHDVSYLPADQCFAWCDRFADEGCVAVTTLHHGSVRASCVYLTGGCSGHGGCDPAHWCGFNRVVDWGACFHYGAGLGLHHCGASTATSIIGLALAVVLAVGVGYCGLVSKVLAVLAVPPGRRREVCRQTCLVRNLLCSLLACSVIPMGICGFKAIAVFPVVLCGFCAIERCQRRQRVGNVLTLQRRQRVGIHVGTPQTVIAINAPAADEGPVVLGRSLSAHSDDAVDGGGDATMQEATIVRTASGNPMLAAQLLEPV